MPYLTARQSYAQFSPQTAQMPMQQFGLPMPQLPQPGVMPGLVPNLTPPFSPAEFGFLGRGMSGQSGWQSYLGDIGEPGPLRYRSVL